MPWYDNKNFIYRKKITIDHTKVGGDLTNFQLFIDLSTLGDDFWDYVKNGGGDIRITTSDMVTEIPREVVSCDTSGKTGEVWALVPSVSSSVNTDVYIYYGNPLAVDYVRTDTYGSDNVWGSAYKYVGHFESNANDSSPNANNGAQRGITTGASVINGDLEMKGETILLDQNVGTDILPFGKATNYRAIAQNFVCPADLSLVKAIICRKAPTTGTLASAVTVHIYPDVAGNPAGSPVLSLSFTVTPTGQWTTLSTNQDTPLFADGALTAGNTYWIRFGSGSSDTDFPAIYYDASGTYGTLKEYDGTNWNTIAGTLKFALATADEVKLASKVLLTYNNFTMSWKMKRTTGLYDCILSETRGNGSGYVSVKQGQNILQFESQTNNLFQRELTCGVTVNDGNYHWYSIVSSPTSFKLIVDGVERYSTTTNTDTHTQDFQYIGTKQAYPYIYGNAFTGFLDEVKLVENVAIATTQLLAEYTNQSDPATFYSSSSKENSTFNAPLPTFFNS